MNNNTYEPIDAKEILGILAKILDGITAEQRKLVLLKLFSREEIETLNDELAIFKSLRDIYNKHRSLEFAIPLAEEIQLTNSFKKDVSEEISHLKYLMSQVKNTENANTGNKKVFVMIPFQKEFLITYEKAIVPSLEELGCKVNKADDLHTVNHIIADIYKQIVEADFLVADTTGRNPNVFYEIGYAHGQNKSVILLAQRAEDIPFDLRSIRHIIYNPNSINVLKEELQLVGKYLLKNKV